MGIIYNRFISDPRPAPVPTWEQVKNNVTATTAFDYSGYNYTEYLILVYYNNSTNYYEFFFIPGTGNYTQQNGTTNLIVYLQPQSNSTITFNVRSSTASTVTGNYRYKIYGRNKATWSLVSDNSALPSYTELATVTGYYTPFNYQVSDYRTAGGTYYTSSAGSYNVSYNDPRERIYNNAYTFNNGGGKAYTRLSSNEANWTHINSTTSSVSIENISFSEMFVVGRKMLFVSGVNEFQALYLIPELLGGIYNSGGYTSKYNTNRYDGSYGSITTSNTSISATYSRNVSGTTQDYFESIDIYYR